MAQRPTDTSIDRFIGRFEEFMERQVEAQKELRADRKMIYEKLEEQSLKIDRLEGSHRAFGGRLIHVETSSTDFNKWKQRFIGMAMIVSLFSSFIAAGVTLLLKKFMVS